MISDQPEVQGKVEKCTQRIQAIIEADQLNAANACDVKCFTHFQTFEKITYFNKGRDIVGESLGNFTQCVMQLWTSHQYVLVQ